MAYRHHDRIRFHHTDAAGVAYFATVLALCHVAYEEALAQFGIPLSLHFSAQGDEILPITSAQIDFSLASILRGSPIGSMCSHN
ncbi:MAG: hypothetical protein HC818_07495 [Synechococcaceae cyanobacterium RM1_1_27]|nr:hypothetical protein [Synechococcaceae cyanobacterium RM1_1_27]